VADDDRRAGPGRRESDRLFDAIWREIDNLRARLLREIDRLEDDLDTLAERLREQVRELEIFHIEERARMGERVAGRARSMARWTKTSIAFGVLGVAFGILEATGVLR
jgi:hypothetical protein